MIFPFKTKVLSILIFNRDGIVSILLLTYKSLNGLAPVYINELLYHYTPCRSLRSSDSNFLAIPKTTTITYGDRSFAAIASKVMESATACH